MNEIELVFENSKYVIINENGKNVCYRLDGEKRVFPTQNELNQVFAELKKINEQSLEDLKRTILEMIRNGQIKNNDELEVFLRSVNVGNNYNILREFGIQNMTNTLVSLEPIEEVANKVIDIFKESKNNDKKVIFNFKRVNILSKDYLEINMQVLNGDDIYNYDKIYVNYDENTYNFLINPLISEMTEEEEIIQNDYINNNENMFDNDVNYKLTTEEHNSLTIINISPYNANEIKKLVEEKRQIKKEELINKPTVRVLEKEENKNNGKINVLIVLGVIVIVIAFLIIFF